jgi:hypothetical protein
MNALNRAANFCASGICEFRSRHFINLDSDPGRCRIRIQSQTKFFFMEISSELKLFYQNKNRHICLLERLQRTFRLREKPPYYRKFLTNYISKFFPFFEYNFGGIRIRNTELSNINCYFFRARDLIRWQQKRLIRIRIK